MLNLTPFLKLYSWQRMRDLGKLQSARVQEKQLFSLLKSAKDTRFGKDHGFESISSVTEFQQRVPLRNYEQFWEDYWEKNFPLLDDCSWPGRIPFFPVSSGTSTGSAKYIPCTRKMIRSNTKAGLDLLSYHVHQNPKSSIFAGKNFLLGGSTALIEEAPGVFSGDLSGILTKELPLWARPRYFPSQDLALLVDWEDKINRLARSSLQEDIRMISGVPSWLLIFFDKVFELRPEAEGNIARIFPNLEMLVHGGVNFAPYRHRFLELFSGYKETRGREVDFREVYPASEGFIAVADRSYNEGLRLSLDHGLFFEFVPMDEFENENPTRHWIGNVQPDINYAIVLSTCAGLWSYVIGDTVRFVDTVTPRILITGRTSYYLSAFGEHVIAEELDQAIAAASEQIGAEVTDYSVSPLYPEKSSELGGHQFIVEFSSSMPKAESLAEFASTIDKTLCRLNDDYRSHRSNGFGLNMPQVVAVPPGMFAAWMKSRGKLGGQNKVPRIIKDDELIQSLRHFADTYEK